METAARAYVRMMMAMTVDGKIATHRREAARFGSGEDQRRLEDQVAWADALLIAAGTIRAYGTTFRVTRPDLVEQRRRDHRKPQPTTVVVTRSLDLPLDLPFFMRQHIPRIVATTGVQEPVARERFRGVADVLPCGDADVDPATLLQLLAERGMTRVLLLGGGTLNAQCIQAGLVDEITVTVAPLLYGGRDAPTIVDGEGFSLADAPRLRLMACDRVADELFLRYEVRRTP